MIEKKTVIKSIPTIRDTVVGIDFSDPNLIVGEIDGCLAFSSALPDIKNINMLIQAIEDSNLEDFEKIESYVLKNKSAVIKCCTQSGFDDIMLCIAREKYMMYAACEGNAE